MKSVEYELQKRHDHESGDPLLAVPTAHAVGSDEASDMRHDEEWHTCESRFDVMYSVNLMLKKHDLQLIAIPERVSGSDEQSYIQIVSLSMKPVRGKIFENREWDGS